MPRVTADGSVRVVGLADLQRELRKADETLPRELRQANTDAAEMVATEARRKATGLGGVQAKAASAIKAKGEQRYALLVIDGQRFPYALGAEFGSIEFKQFPAWRGNGSGAGYFVYPTIRDTRDRFIDIYADLIDKVTKSAFPD